MEIYKNNPNNLPSPWLAARASSIIPSTPGLRALVDDVNSALTIKINQDIIEKIKEFEKLSLEDLELLIPQTAFTHPLIWVEWNAETDFIELVNPKEKRKTEEQENPSVAQVGAMIKTDSSGQLGFVSYVASADDVFVLPLGMSFNWKLNYKLDEESINQLKINITSSNEPPTENGEPLSDEKVNMLVSINSRFGLEQSIYVKIPEDSINAMTPIINESAKFVLQNNIFIVGLANILECCETKDWREAKLLIN